MPESSPRRGRVRTVNGDGERRGCGKLSALRVVYDDIVCFLCRQEASAVKRYVTVTGQDRSCEGRTPKHDGRDLR